MPEVSVVIVNYNGGAMVADTVNSVVQTTDREFCEIIVVDNHSSDGSAENIRTVFGGQVRIVNMPDNMGFAAANNAGCSIAKGRYILFLNPDTVVLGNAIQTLADYLSTHPDTGACGGNLFDKDMNPQFSYWTLLPGVKMEWHSLWSFFWLKKKHNGSHEHNFTGSPQEVAYIMGADMMVRKELIDRLGGMDEDFFLFYEETELCRRISRAGYRIVSVPDAHIIHMEGQTIDRMNIRRKYMMRSRDIYLRKCCPPFERHTANAILFISSMLRTVWFALACNKEKKEFWKYTMTHITNP